MRFLFLQVAAALALFGFAGSHARAVDIYVLSGNGDSTVNTTTGFGKIDTATGIYTEISPAVSGGNTVGNLAWNAANSAFYVTENIDANDNLRTLSTSGTLSSPIGTIGKYVYGMAYRPADRTLYAYDFWNDKTGTINPATGAWTELNTSTGIYAFYTVGGRYSLLNDRIYVSTGDGNIGQFGTFGFTASSAFSQIGSNNDLYKNINLASDGTTLYGVYGDETAGNQKLYSIDPSNGATTFMTNISGLGLGKFFYGAGTTVVPEPSTYALGTIATGVMAFIARRRRGRKA